MGLPIETHHFKIHLASVIIFACFAIAPHSAFVPKQGIHQRCGRRGRDEEEEEEEDWLQCFLGSSTLQQMTAGTRTARSPAQVSSPKPPQNSTHSKHKPTAPRVGELLVSRPQGTAVDSSAPHIAAFTEQGSLWFEYARYRLDSHSAHSWNALRCMHMSRFLTTPDPEPLTLSSFCLLFCARREGSFRGFCKFFHGWRSDAGWRHVAAACRAEQTQQHLFHSQHGGETLSPICERASLIL